MQKKIKTLVVDDTIVYRKVVSDILNELPDIEVVGSANNGKIAMSKIKSLKPDLLILDIEMPEKNGLELLSDIKEQSLDIGVIMLSSFTQDGSDQTIKALELGAFDFITKPATDSIEQSKQQVQQSLCGVVNAFVKQAETRNILAVKTVAKEPPVNIQQIADRSGHVSKAVAIGISTGGPNSLHAMLPELPEDIGVPIFIVQHMPALFTKSLADSLNKKCKLTIVEASDREKIEPNKVYIAPGGKQMKLDVSPARGRIIKITDDPPENNCKPSVDYLFRSVSELYGPKCTSVVMTGMGSDGKAGMTIMKENGAVTIAQNEATCVVYGMPKEVINVGIVDVVAPLDSIAEQICKTVRLSSLAGR